MNGATVSRCLSSSNTAVKQHVQLVTNCMGVHMLNVNNKSMMMLECRPVDEGLAALLREFRSPSDNETRMFYEVVIAPGYTPEGLAKLKGKSKTLRILEAKPRAPEGQSLRQVAGGTPSHCLFLSLSPRSVAVSLCRDFIAFLCLLLSSISPHALHHPLSHCQLVAVPLPFVAPASPPLLLHCVPLPCFCRMCMS